MLQIFFCNYFSDFYFFGDDTYITWDELDFVSGSSTNFLSRIQGYFVPHTDSYYEFWMSVLGRFHLYLNPNEADPNATVGLFKIITVYRNFWPISSLKLSSRIMRTAGSTQSI